MISFPERLYAAGITDLIPVIPPGAQLVPSSKIPQAAIGKIPGRRHPSGLWAGLNWRILNASADQVAAWVADGANIGLRATNFPGVDIDVSDPALAQMIEDAVLGHLGFAPVRIGKPPKRLLMYALSDAEPFSRMRLWINTFDGGKHLIEILGEGQQYLVHGTHPSGKEYVWRQDPTERPLVAIGAEQANACLDYIAQLIDVAGIGTTEREGDGKRSTRTAADDQTSLLAPSIDVLREAVSLIPNSNEQFPSRTDYLRFGYAIRAAAGAEHDDDGCEIFQEWAERWDGGTNPPDTVRDDYRRFTPPYSVGWTFLAQLARPHGFVDAALDFDIEDEAPLDISDDNAPDKSDQWLAEQVVSRCRSVLRYVPQRTAWLVWDGMRWALDAELLAEDTIVRALKQLAIEALRKGSTAKEKAGARQWAATICSAGKATAVAQLVRLDRAIAVSAGSLDHNEWALNTPGGIVDLKTGVLGPPNPDALATRMTLVAPDFDSASPEWDRFLDEATGHDAELQAYLQRLVGYALTGSTREQHLSFIWGPGGYGKGTFLNAVIDILGDYAVVASMDSFTVGYGDKHSTDLAMMVGARLVAASETTAGKRWDDQRVKSLTGGDRVTARFMRQDNFTYTPQFKLLFIGNTQPELREVDKAMRRRIQMVPFATQPARDDKELKVKLRAEFPAILAWAVRGCLAWQAQGLNPPPVVKISTEEYFDEEDSYGQWIEECVKLDVYGVTTFTQDLFQSWQEWANPRKIPPGTAKRLSAALATRGWVKWRDAETRRRGFSGIQLIKGEGLGNLL